MKYKKEILIGLFAGVLNGLLGAGGGCVVVPALEKLLDFPKKKAHATAVGIILIISVTSAVIYLLRGDFDFGMWGKVTIGGIAGGVVGGKLLSVIPEKWLRLIFGIGIMVTSVKMIF